MIYPFKKTEHLKNFGSHKKIVITSNNSVIDFKEKSTKVTIEFNDEEKPSYPGIFLELYIQNRNQPQTTVTDFSIIPGKSEATVTIESNYDLADIIVATR